MFCLPKVMGQRVTNAKSKSLPSKSEGDIRPILKTFFFSKVYESFIGKWLLPIIHPYIDLGIQDLYDMHTPGWILAILLFYLSGLSMTMTFGKSTSSPRKLPGSTPQGALLGGLIFIVKYNGASLRPQIPRITLSTCKPFQSVC